MAGIGHGFAFGKCDFVGVLLSVFNLAYGF